MSVSNDQNKPSEPKKALGRGLAALLGEQKDSHKEAADEAQKNQANNVSSQVKGVEITEKLDASLVEKKPIPQVKAPESEFYREIELSKIEANPDQPRKHFNVARLEELATSLKEQGLVQPIVVRPLDSGNFQIVAGERRWRAAKLAGLEKIPVFIRKAALKVIDNDLASLVENIQREDLSPIELAHSYDRMLRVHNFTQESLATKLGVSRVSVANTIRLLKLPESVKEMVNSKSISEGHSRALLALSSEEEMIHFAKEILEKGLTVRDVENRIKMRVMDIASSGAPDFMAGAQMPKGGIAKLSELSQIEDELRTLFGTKVSVRGNPNRGAIEIYFSGKDSLNRILHQIRSLNS